ncbi:MAG: N-acetyl-gamma-glutamyl-phosphate reductase [Candidatus Aminicenantes bacterium]|nr:N-acetyl-gamma-glutamyl-phosphate reductase [Candidatus Aminicenantes bacterium]
MSKISVSIAGGSGYTGGELLRLLLFHPHVKIKQVTSEKYAGKPVFKIHPNLRTITSLRFSTIEELKDCDCLFLALSHGRSLHKIDFFCGLAPKLIDLSSDFRLLTTEQYRRWYGINHPRPELLTQFVYGIPEIHRQEIKSATRVACAGCNATAALLGLYPLYQTPLCHPAKTIVEVKAGSSQSGRSPSPGSHHPERNGCYRVYQPTGHRHIGEILQELSLLWDSSFHFTATSVEMVRGIQAVSHVFLSEPATEKDIWKTYRQFYGSEPFIRIVKDNSGLYRLPEPKILSGTNFCDIGFSKDPLSDHLVVVSALDNLMKGAAGQAVQNFNIMNGLPEKTALNFPGLHPI